MFLNKLIIRLLNRLLCWLWWCLLTSWNVLNVTMTNWTLLDWCSLKRIWWKIISVCCLIIKEGDDEITLNDFLFESITQHVIVWSIIKFQLLHNLTNNWQFQIYFINELKRKTTTKASNTFKYVVDYFHSFWSELDVEFLLYYFFIFSKRSAVIAIVERRIAITSSKQFVSQSIKHFLAKDARLCSSLQRKICHSEYLIWNLLMFTM
jgi:hypothetical protein